MVKVVIDGQEIEAQSGQTVLEVARLKGIDIPTLCYYKALTPYAACRICIVEASDLNQQVLTTDSPIDRRKLRRGEAQKVEKNSWLTTACSYQVWDGLDIETNSPKVRLARKTMLEFMIARAPKAERIQALAAEYGAVADPDDVRPDSDCILCGLCTRMCSDMMGVGAIGMEGRGIDRKVTTPFGEKSEICISCGACAYVCPTGSRAVMLENINGRTPVKIPTEWDQGLCNRPSIHIPFPQAVPNVPVMDENNCVKLNTGQCGACEHFCEPNAIKYDQEDTIEEVDVGTIILSTGFKTFDAERIKRYGYGKYPNVYTSLEVERLVNASGPTGGKVVLKDNTVPESIGIVHCVGSRDNNSNKYCSRVCCMYSLKLAHLLKEHTGAEVYNFYIDMRTPGKGYDEFYDRLLEEGNHFIRGRVAQISDWALREPEEGKLIIRAEDTLVGSVRRIPVDMVVLAVGLEPQADAEDIRRLFNISCSTEGWFLERHPKLAPVSTFTDGVFLAGACQGPKDIPDSVAQAGAAAAEALSLIDKGFVELEPNTAFIEEEHCSGCKTCIGLCPFTALVYKEEADERAFTEVNEALCKGCGTCVAACPSGAIQQNLFTDEQIFEEILGVLNYV